MSSTPASPSPALRLFPSARRRLFGVPLDHSVSMGPIDGLESVTPLARELQEAGADLLIVTKGAVRELTPSSQLPHTLLGIHMSASTGAGGATANHKVRVGMLRSRRCNSVPTSLSVQVNLWQVQGGARDAPSTWDLPWTSAAPSGSRSCAWRMLKKDGAVSPDELRHAARASADLGADVVKTRAVL